MKCHVLATSQRGSDLRSRTHTCRGGGGRGWTEGNTTALPTYSVVGVAGRQLVSILTPAHLKYPTGSLVLPH